MVFTVFVLAGLFAIASTVFVGLAANAYFHVPAKVKVEIRHSEMKQRS